MEELEISDKREQEGVPYDDVVRQTEMRETGPLGKLHNITVHIRSSGPRTKEFVSSAKKMIPLDNRTRWNSWYAMISTAIKLEKEVDFYAKKQPDLKKDVLCETDWQLLRTIAEFLGALKDVTVNNEGYGKTLAVSLPWLYVVRWRIKLLIEAFRGKPEKVRSFGSSVNVLTPIFRQNSNETASYERKRRFEPGRNGGIFYGIIHSTRLPLFFILPFVRCGFRM